MQTYKYDDDQQHYAFQTNKIKIRCNVSVMKFYRNMPSVTRSSYPNFQFL